MFAEQAFAGAPTILGELNRLPLVTAADTALALTPFGLIAPPLPSAAQLVALHRRIADASAFEGGQCLWDVGTGGAIREVFLGAQGPTVSRPTLMSWLSAPPAAAIWRASSRSDG
jgi:hypothetical protein